jgi:hypothetical protein
VVEGSDPASVFQEGLRSLGSGRLDDAERLLVRAARSGHDGAMARLGRLYCLDPHRYGAGEDSAERWLRQAVAASPGDALSATLLASLLIRWANDMIAAQADNGEPALYEWYRWPDRVDDAYWTDPDCWLDWEDSERERRTVAAHERLNGC